MAGDLERILGQCLPPLPFDRGQTVALHGKGDMKTRNRDFLKLRSATVSARLGDLWLIIVNGEDLLALEAACPTFKADYAYFRLGRERSSTKVRASFWKIVGPLSASGDFYVLMRAELASQKTGKAT